MALHNKRGLLNASRVDDDQTIFAAPIQIAAEIDLAVALQNEGCAGESRDRSEKFETQETYYNNQTLHLILRQVSRNCIAEHEKSADYLLGFRGWEIRSVVRSISYLAVFGPEKLKITPFSGVWPSTPEHSIAPARPGLRTVTSPIVNPDNCR